MPYQHTLEDRIYILQKTNLPDDLSYMLQQADQYYVQYLDKQAEELVAQIEKECVARNIKLFKPLNCFAELIYT